MRSIAILIIWVAMFMPVPATGVLAEQVRESVIAGSWYPGSESALGRQVNEFLERVPFRDDAGRLVALISPHAGYQYSGQMAAHAYKLLQGRSFDTVVIVAPSHHAAFSGVSVYDRGGYRTPMGLVPLDTAFIKALKKTDKKIRYVSRAHSREHSLEIQLPFIQTVMPDFKLVPLVMGDQNIATSRRLARALADCAENKSVLLVASTDLSHYHDRQTARKLDGQVVSRVSAFDPEGIHTDLARGKCEACGGGPMVAVMMAARRLGADRSEILHVGDSGDASGDNSRVVGYMAAAFWAEKEDTMPDEGKDNMTDQDLLGPEAQQILKEIARGAIDGALEKKPYSVPETIPDILKQPCGAFVTLTKNRQLRGCIGHIVASGPLSETVRQVAVAAAFEDPRFSPLTSEEWPKVELEVSVLTPLEPISDTSIIETGVHGLYIRRGLRSGLLLPQVAIEYGWDRQTFLEQTCRKAGLRKNDWKDEETQIYCFKAQVF